MKKLFVCAMALAAFVSCSKDDVQGPALDSKTKSVQITIENAVNTTRAEGGITAAGVNNEACADADDLWVLFADTKGDIKHKAQLTDQAETDPHPEGAASDVDPCTPGAVTTDEAGNTTYIWHNVDVTVTKIAVVRTNGNEADNFKTLKEYSDLASNESANLARGLDEIVLYGEDVLEDTGKTHRIGDIVYHVWHADVLVAPAFARFEISKLQCKDLGDANAVASGATYGFDELVVNGLKWRKAADAENTYSYTAKNFTGTLYGSYVPTTPKEGYDYVAGTTPTETANRLNYINAGTVTVDGVDKAKAWSWNVADQTEFDELIVDLTAKAYDYKITSPSVPLTVIDLKQGETINNKFVKGNIYTLALEFEEENIIDPEGLCVTVKVTIQPWTVKTVSPVFTKPAAASAQ